MIRTSAVPRRVHPDCRAFVAVVEELLERRQRDSFVTGQPSHSWQTDEWGPRKWHRTELEDMVYSSYRRMRQGSITRPPRRQVVLDIADYLNCSLEERNRLLVAAHLLPVEPYLTGDDLRALVELSAEAAHHLAMPWMIINRDWRIHYTNSHLLDLYDISAAEVAAIEPERFNVLHLLFDPTLPFYANMMVDRDAWTEMALLTVRGFRQANRFCEYEPWYHEGVSRLMALPDFSSIWQRASTDHPSNAPIAEAVFATMLPALRDPSCVARLRPLLISAGYFQFDFPRIVGFVPADISTQALFERVGLPFPQTSLESSTEHFVL